MGLKKGDKVMIKGFYEIDFPYGGEVMDCYPSRCARYCFFEVRPFKKTIFGNIKLSKKFLNYKLFSKEDLIKWK